MNIFYLDHNTSICAKYHNDKHVVKMVLEYAQILCTVQRLGGSTDKRLYKATHTAHPSVLWAKASRANFRWLHSLFVDLVHEYRHRWGKVHGCASLALMLRKPPKSIPNLEFTQPTQAMPDGCKDDDSIVAYRTYYTSYKRHIAVWTKRGAPTWWR